MASPCWQLQFRYPVPALRWVHPACRHVFPPHQQTQIRLQLAITLAGVVSQQLLPRAGGGRVAAREILINTPAVANLIRNNEVGQIKSAIQTGAKDGMVSMENSLKQLVKEGIISEETANNRVGRAKKV